mgnify:FL=1
MKLLHIVFSCFCEMSFHAFKAKDVRCIGFGKAIKVRLHPLCVWSLT